MHTRLSSSLFAPFLIAAAGVTGGACAAKTLTVGSGDGPGSSSTESVATQGSCTSASCGNQTLACVGGGTPTHLECVPHPDASGPSIFMGTCILQGECAATTGETGAEAGTATSTATSGTSTCVTTPLSNCGATSNGAVCSEISGGSGVVTVEIDPTPGDAGVTTTQLSAFFTSGSESTTSQQTFGACTLNPYGGEQGESGVQGPAPNPGSISVTASGFSGSLYPACDGTYASLTSQQAPVAGSLASVAWNVPAGNPWQFPTSTPSVPTPHFLAIAAGDALSTSSPSVPRGQDLTLAWTVGGTPEELEQAILVFTQGNNTVSCTFPSSAHSGSIPAEALLQLGAGAASYSFFSQTLQQTSEPGTSFGGWEVDFAVQAVATTPTGLATGAITLE